MHPGQETRVAGRVCPNVQHPGAEIDIKPLFNHLRELESQGGT